MTQVDIDQVDSLLFVCVNDYNNSLTEGHDYAKIDLIGQVYQKQLMVVKNSKGEKEVWVNCFCSNLPQSWTTEVHMVEDGGPCFFNFKINIATKVIYDLMVNGSA